MKSASLAELKKELLSLKPSRLSELILRIAKYKKENKELLTYLLFESDDEKSFIKNIKDEVDQQFEEMNKSNTYLAKKSLRKILRFVNKHIKYSGLKETEAELLLYFCFKAKASGIPIRKNTVLTNLYEQQLKKINKAIDSMHEDLQYDYQQELKKCNL
jgi:hypothetical protein